jgi:hypothetical protein
MCKTVRPASIYCQFLADMADSGEILFEAGARLSYNSNCECETGYCRQNKSDDVLRFEESCHCKSKRSRGKDD